MDPVLISNVNTKLPENNKKANETAVFIANTANKHSGVIIGSYVLKLIVQGSPVHSMVVLISSKELLEKIRNDIMLVYALTPFELSLSGSTSSDFLLANSKYDSFEYVESSRVCERPGFRHILNLHLVVFKTYKQRFIEDGVYFYQGAISFIASNDPTEHENVIGNIRGGLGNITIEYAKYLIGCSQEEVVKENQLISQMFHSIQFGEKFLTHYGSSSFDPFQLKTYAMEFVRQANNNNNNQSSSVFSKLKMTESSKVKSSDAVVDSVIDTVIDTLEIATISTSTTTAFTQFFTKSPAPMIVKTVKTLTYLYDMKLETEFNDLLIHLRNTSCSKLSGRQLSYLGTYMSILTQLMKIEMMSNPSTETIHQLLNDSQPLYLHDKSLHDAFGKCAFHECTPIELNELFGVTLNLFACLVV